MDFVAESIANQDLAGRTGKQPGSAKKLSLTPSLSGQDFTGLIANSNVILTNSVV
jgi:hypothetical protein